MGLFEDSRLFDDLVYFCHLVVSTRFDGRGKVVVRGERRAMDTEPLGGHDVNAFLDVFELAVKSSDQINRACITEGLHLG